MNSSIIQIEVTDRGQPNLSATNRFSVVVRPISPPILGSIIAMSGELDLVANGPTGPDYTLLTSTNLVDWQPVLTVLSAAPPVTLVDTNYPNGAVRFYRVQLGP